MKTIARTDIIYATLRSRGTTLANKCLSGMDSFADIVRSLSSESSRCSGLVTLMVRNGTQGWTDSRSMVLPRRGVTPKAAQPRQLTLF